MEAAGANCHFMNIKYSPGLCGPPAAFPTLDTCTHSILKLNSEGLGPSLPTTSFQNQFGVTPQPKADQLPTAVSRVGMGVPVAGAQPQMHWHLQSTKSDQLSQRLFLSKAEAHVES